MESRKECVVLLDNGSLRAEAVLSLRRIALELEEEIGERVNPVSLLHSSKIPCEELGGVPADTWRRFLRSSLERGVSRFRLVPLFFGPSSAIVDYLPKVSAEVLKTRGGVEISVAKPLIDMESPEEDSVARILESLLIQKLDTVKGGRTGLVLVDHGSPLRQVADCRNHVADQLAGLLGSRVEAVIAASMERREGDEYVFNEPLLETALERARELGWERLILSYLFFSPGRHAGPGGDIERIVAASAFVREGGEVEAAPLFGESRLLVPLLAKRFAGPVDR